MADGIDKGRIATEIEGFGGMLLSYIAIPSQIDSNRHVIRHYYIYTNAQ